MLRKRVRDCGGSVHQNILPRPYDEVEERLDGYLPPNRLLNGPENLKLSYASHTTAMNVSHYKRSF